MATLRELSAACGLSVSTVSKALNDYSDVGDDTRALVRRKAEELGYHPNAIARSLKMGRTFNLGVVFSDDNGMGFMHSFFAPVLQSFKTEAERHGYDITFITSHMGHTEMTYLHHCRSRQVDGVCIVCAEYDNPEIVELMRSDLPVVAIDYPGSDAVCVRSDNYQGMWMLVEYILRRGHRRIAYVTGENTPVTRVRRQAFLDAMRSASLSVPDRYIVEGRFHHPGKTREAVARLLKVPDRPSCILMPDDYAAVGGMEALRAAGLRIPEDISVTGFDGVRFMQLCKPSLTTVAQDTERIGHEAALRLICQVEDHKRDMTEIRTIACRLVQGETVWDIN